MGIDELIARNVGILRGYLSDTLIRWRDVANDARAPGFTIDQLFERTREQFVRNWDTWVSLVSPGALVPTLTIQSAAGALAGKAGAVIVRQRLTGLVDADFTRTPLELFGGTQSIAGSDYAVAVEGDFDRRIRVTMQAAAPTAGTYRGLVLAELPGAVGPEPVAWVVVVAT